jgi:hypothetical protein
MASLTKAHHELFRREPDECFESFESLQGHCLDQREKSVEQWHLPQRLVPNLSSGRLQFDLDNGDRFRLNDWSFGQLCKLCGVSRDTINRLQPDTANQAIRDTLPTADKPLQILGNGNSMRSIHGVTYTRLWNAELLDVVNEFASDFTPPQKAGDGQGTGLYCGEQDMFAFLIDPTGWAEIEGEAFAPGFFVWNSEVGRRSVGIQTFWFQRVCQNHIVWDAIEVAEFSRKHTSNVRDGLTEIRHRIEQLVARRDERRDSFASAIKKAMTEKLGADADEVTKALSAESIPRYLIKDAMNIARQRGGFTIFSLVDALTQLSQKVRFAGDRAALDARIGQLLALAA